MILGQGRKIHIHMNEQISTDQTFQFCRAYSLDNSETYNVKVVNMKYAIKNKLLIEHLSQIHSISSNALNNEMLFYNHVMRSENNLYFVYNCFPHSQLAKLLEKNEINFNQNSIIDFAFNLGKLIQRIHDRNYILGNLCPSNIYFSDRDSFSDIRFDISPFMMVRGSNFRLENFSGLLHYQYPELLNNNHQEITNLIDIYSYGSLLYECLFKEPYSLENVNYKFNFNKDLKEILELIISCTKPNPNERKSMAEILNQNIFKVCQNFFNIKERDVENDFNLTLIKEENNYSYCYERFKASEKQGKKSNKFYEIVKINPSKFDKNVLKDLLQKEIKVSTSILKSDFCPRYEGFYTFKNNIFLIKHFIQNCITLEEYIERMINTNEKSILSGIEGVLLQEWLSYTLYQLFTQAKMQCIVNPRNIIVIFDENKRIFGIKLYDFGFLESIHQAILKPIYPESLILNYYFPIISEMPEEKYYLFILGLITYFIVQGKHLLNDSNNKSLLSQNKFNLSFPKMDQELEVLKSITQDCLNYKSDLKFSIIFNKLRKNNNYIKLLNEIPKKYIIDTNPDQSLNENIYHTKDNKQVVKKYYIKNVAVEDEDIQGKMTEIKAVNLIIALNSFKKCKYITQIVDSFRIENVLYVVENNYGNCSLDYFYRYYIKNEEKNVKNANMKTVGKCIGKAIQFLSSLSYIHRKVCPSNIIVKVSNEKIVEAALCGFSSCKHLSLKYQMKVK